MAGRFTQALIGILLVVIVATVVQAASPEPTTRDSAGAYPVAVDPAKVGTYPALTKSGGGRFYDDVLEYRVWVHPEDGDDYFRAFATYEQALAFSQGNKRAEPPLVLVFQRECVGEPQKGRFEWVKEPRITEWRVEWLAGNKRTPRSIPDFLAHKRAATSPAERGPSAP